MQRERGSVGRGAQSQSQSQWRDGQGEAGSDGRAGAYMRRCKGLMRMMPGMQLAMHAQTKPLLQ